jgi:hypothetical protein
MLLSQVFEPKLIALYLANYINTVPNVYISFVPFSFHYPEKYGKIVT